jgi:hypothetical protein
VKCLHANSGMYLCNIADMKRAASDDDVRDDDDRGGKRHHGGASRTEMRMLVPSRVCR